MNLHRNHTISFFPRRLRAVRIFRRISLFSFRAAAASELSGTRIKGLSCRLPTCIQHARRNGANNQQHPEKCLERLHLAEDQPSDRNRVDKTGVIYYRDAGGTFLLQRTRKKDLAKL